jgi:hypothetical protein
MRIYRKYVAYFVVTAHGTELNRKTGPYGNKSEFVTWILFICMSFAIGVLVIECKSKKRVYAVILFQVCSHMEHGCNVHV